MKVITKICGLTRAEDVALCHALGVDFTGFIFAPKSPRCIAPEAVAAMPAGASRRVGVFVNEPVESMLGIVRKTGLDYVQLHGGEGVSVCEAMGPERVIKVLWPESMNAEEFSQAIRIFAPVCAYFLLDAGQGGGGSGNNAGQPYLRERAFPRPWLLAGGIGAHNAAEMIRVYSPNGLDMNSALESAPGVKDRERVRAAVEAIRAL